jgi:uncharacterized membrane protein YkvA (DUF1232 family)
MENPTLGQSMMSFYSLLRERVDSWLASAEAARTPHAELYRQLPELYRFLVELALDDRVGEQERACTLSAVKYVVAPYDLIPEAVVGTSGFRDDLVLAAMMTDRVCDACGAALVAEHWPSAGNPQAIARTILDAATAMVGGDICDRLRAWLPN